MRLEKASSSNASQPIDGSLGSPVHCVIEQLESRQFFSASLQIQNMDIIPGYERMIFSKVGQLDANFPNKFKDTGMLRLRNGGDQTLNFSGVKMSGPFKIVSGMPTSLAPGKFADVKIQFTATAPPAFTYNQTAGTTNQYDGGTWLGSLKFNTNDPNNTVYTEALAGWYQRRSERNQEPSLQTAVNLIMDYKTYFAPPKTVFLTQGSEAKYYGEEVVSAYWKRADTSKNVGVRQIAAYHTQGNKVPISWFGQSNKAQHHIFTHDGAWGQSFLPTLQGTNSPAFGSFATNETFGFKVDTEWSDRTLNKNQQFGGGHHLRFFPARDHFGNLLPNTYFLVGDYSILVGGSAPNNDFQDNIYIITNVKPANGAVPPPTSPPPTSPPPTSPPPTSGSRTVSISPANVSVNEGNSGSKTVSFTVSLSSAATSNVSVAYTTANGGAAKGSDYVGKYGSLVFSPGQTSKVVTVNVIGDTVKEVNELFYVNLYSPSGAALGNAQSKVTIVNDDGVTTAPSPVPPPTSPTSPPVSPPPTSGGTPIVSIKPGSVSVVEGNSGTKAVTLTVSVDRPVSSQVKVFYTTANGGAAKGSDYVGAAGTIAFYKGGVTSRTVTIYVTGETAKEVNEDFYVRLYGIEGGALGTSSAKITIVNND